MMSAQAFMDADKAVYRAKAGGRACYVVATANDDSDPSLSQAVMA